MLNLLNDATPCFTFLTVALIYVSEAARNCVEVECRDDQRCCRQGNGSTTANSCCKLEPHTFYDNVGWMTRKLSGILILSLLFAMGYFIQRMICPRPRRHHDGGTATASQDSLLDRFPTEYSLENFTSPVLQLPAYDEVKYLPTYEETMQEVHRDRSNDHLLTPSSVEPASVAVTGPRAAAPDTRTSRNSV